MPQILIVLCLLALITACGNSKKISTASPSESSTVESTSTKVLELNGRQYRLAYPKAGFDENKAYKLLLAFHGSGQTAQQMQSMSQLEKYSDDYLVVYPSSKEVEWDDGCGCNIAHRLAANDVEFVVAIIEKMHAEYSLIDGENYAVGFSQGGLFSQNMLCKHSDLFKGVASVASPMSVQLSAECRIAQPTNYLMIHGKLDKVLPYDGFKHNNFGLISAPNAIETIAKENLIEVSPIILEEADNVTTLTYQDEQSVTSKLITIDNGFHTWFFSKFNTSKEVLKFFNQHSRYNFPEGSALFRLEQGDYHVRTLGEPNESADVVVLSGANKYFHSDSAWTSLIHNKLAEHGRVHVIDRLGSAWSSDTSEPSFSLFAADLPKILDMLKVKSVIFVAFSNSNLATLMYQDSAHPDIETKGFVWVDPDILLPHSIALYQSGSVAGLRAYRSQYIEHVSAGNWTEKTASRVAEERDDIRSLIPMAYQSDMDWEYYDLVTQQRLDVSKQVTRLKEMMNYHDDLEIAKYLVSGLTVPVSIIDGDFERFDIAATEGSVQENLIKWQEEGSEWSKMMASSTEGEYIPLENVSHQLLFEHPEKVVDAVRVLLNK
ncbi:alpha/beta hydrolase [Pseudoalteromonas aurantia]|uniref:Alpha/beta hydrolase n=1 Tax=Pseudoalteromonas aurantia TaxID=43654 RepID=A0ABY2VZ63_9GAMM|nr:alpha/beta hydrolase [Pseudoalteromonas aurantia]TMO61773.1 alpha/beta hydrolase [Pseudoalteromonas aurantia]TMO75565.1 alpha/beta hydrolase [Pseudoalteromonas aurantia]